MVKVKISNFLKVIIIISILILLYTIFNYNLSNKSIQNFTGGNLDEINSNTPSLNKDITMLVNNKKYNRNNVCLVRHPYRDITSASAFYLEPIIKNIYKDKIIEYTDDQTVSCDIIVRSFWNKDYDNNEKYIFVSPEPNKHPHHANYTYFYKFLNDNCICAFLTSLDMIKNYKIHKPNIKYYYLPYFLDVMEYTQQFRDIDLTTNNIYMRPKIAAYITNYAATHRAAMFKALKALDTNNLVDSLGKSDRTVSHNIYSPHWKDLPEIYKDYKFVFTMENINEEGYITEKIMNAYRAGAIPIYWGTDYVKRIFNPESFVYVLDYKSYEDCAEHIMELANNPAKLLKMQRAAKFNKNLSANEIDYSKYYDDISPQWVIDISQYIKSSI